MPDHPAGASLHLGGDAWAHPGLEATGAEMHHATDLIPFPGNPRRGDQDAITASLREVGLYRALIVQTTTLHVLAGNHTLRALLELGATRVPVTWVDVDDTRAAQIVARDNRTSDRGGYDDTEQLALLEALAAQDELPGSGYTTDDLDALRAAAEPSAYVPPVVAPSLADRFVVPPFSVLDQRAGAWQDRKRRWLALGIQSEVGRGDGGVTAGGHSRGAAGSGLASLLNYDPDTARANARANDAANRQRKTLGAVQTNLDGVDAERYGRKKVDARTYTNTSGLAKIKPGLKGALTAERTLGQGLQAHRDPATGELVYEAMAGTAGVSIFDPVLTELAYRWFSPMGGHVLDPFAGGSVRGIVASALGRSYTGVELRHEQVTANIEQAQSIVPRLGQGDHPLPYWVTGDSREVLAPGAEVGMTASTLDAPADLVFSCPPYADLEVYSDDPADLSAMPYDHFLEAYRAIIAAACARLRDDRYAVWVIGEVRDKRGLYRNLVGDTTQAFLDAGLAYYNEAILVTPVGSLPIRAGRQFAAGRKLGKTHQNVLVFVKGDPRAAADACGTVDVTLPDVTGVEDQ